MADGGSEYDVDRFTAALRQALNACEAADGERFLPNPLPSWRWQPPQRLPVLDWLGFAVTLAPPPAQPFAKLLHALSPKLRWRQTYDPGVVSDYFLTRYGWTELIGANAPMEDATTSAGLLLLGPETLYPTHFHPAVEHYVPLSGTAAWFDEDHDWRDITPLSLISHRSMVRHAMRTGAQPLLAFFHWSGPDIGQAAKMA